METIEICNLALGIIGAPRILNANDSSEYAIRCRDLFPVCRDRLLRSSIWSFSIASAALQLSADAPAAADFAAGCRRPGDLIRVFKLESREPYLLRGDFIYVRNLPQTLIYCRRIEDASRFDPAFADALVFAIAAELALPATRDANLANYIRAEFTERIRAAQSCGAIENPHEFQRGERFSAFLNARREE